MGLGQSGCYLPGIHPTEGTSSCVYILYTQEVTRPRRIYTYVEIECQFCSKKSLKCSVLQKFAYKNFMPCFFVFLCRNFCSFPIFLAHLNQRLQWGLLIRICSLSVVVGIVVNFSHFHLLLQWSFSQKFLRLILILRENVRYCSFSQILLREYLRVKSAVTLRQF